MKASSRTIAVIAALGFAAAGIGFLVGKGSLEPGADQAGGKGDDVGRTPATAAEFDFAAPRELATLRQAAAEALELGMERLKSGDLLSALSVLVDIEDEVARKEAYFELIAQLDGAQLGELIELIRGASEDSSGEAGEVMELLFDDITDAFALFDRWVELDIDAVAAFVTDTAKPGQDYGLDVNVMFSALSLAFIAQRDPARARGLLDTFSGDESPWGENSGLVAEAIVAFGTSLGDPALGVRTYLESMDDDSDGPDMDDMFEMLGSRVGEALPEVLGIADTERRDDALEDLFQAWGDSDPAAALAAAEGLEASDIRTEVVDEILERYIQTDPDGATAYVEALPEGPARDKLISRLASDWIQVDPGQALAWVGRTLGDRAVASTIALDADELSPEVGLALVSEMTPEGREVFFRQTSFGDNDHFFWRWARSDPELGSDLDGRNRSGREPKG